jgi:hypothetical protein
MKEIYVLKDVSTNEFYSGQFFAGNISAGLADHFDSYAEAVDTLTNWELKRCFAGRIIEINKYFNFK